MDRSTNKIQWNLAELQYLQFVNYLFKDLKMGVKFPPAIQFMVNVLWVIVPSPVWSSNVPASLMVVYAMVFVPNPAWSSSVPASFMVAFQSTGSVGSISTDEWAEFQGNISRLHELTVCHWEFLKFFNTNENNIWSYCFKERNTSAAVQCLQFWYNADPATGNRQTSHIDS